MKEGRKVEEVKWKKEARWSKEKDISEGRGRKGRRFVLKVLKEGRKEGRKECGEGRKEGREEGRTVVKEGGGRAAAYVLKG